MFGRKFAKQVPAWQLAFKSVSVERRRAAARELMEACFEETNPSPALPLIEAMLRDPDEDIGDYATCSASKCGAASFPVLARLAADADAIVRERVCSVIGNLAGDTRSLHPAVFAALSDVAPGVRAQAAFAVGRIAEGSRVTIDALAAVIRDQDPKVRMWAFAGLKQFAAKEESRASVRAHLPAIFAALADDDWQVRQTALSALWELELPVEHVLPPMLEVLKTEQVVEVLSTIRQLLFGLGGRTDLGQHLPAMLDIAAGNSAGSALIFEICGDLGVRAESALPQLEEAVQSDDVSYEAVYALWKISGSVEKCIQPLERLLNKQWSGASRALELLATLTDARPYLIPMLRHALPNHPDEVAGKICELGAEAAPLLPDLVRAIDENWDEPDWDLMWAFIDALLAMETSDALAVATFGKLLTHPSPRIRYLALEGLDRAGPAAHTAAGALWRARDDEDGEVAKAARAVLRRIEKPN